MKEKYRFRNYSNNIDKNIKTKLKKRNDKKRIVDWIYNSVEEKNGTNKRREHHDSVIKLKSNKKKHCLIYT